MAVGSPRLIVRMAQDLIDLIDEAAALSGIARSDWVRGACEMQATKELRSGRDLGEQPAEPAARCIHPPTARVTLVDRVMCSLCSATLRRTM